MDLALRRAAGTEADEAPFAQVIDERLAEDAARGISGAEDQHVVDELAAHEGRTRRADAGELARRANRGRRRVARRARVAALREERFRGGREQVQGSHT